MKTRPSKRRRRFPLTSEIDKLIIKEGSWRFIKVNSLGHKWYIAKTPKDKIVLSRKDKDGDIRAVFLPEELEKMNAGLSGQKPGAIITWLEQMIEIKKQFADASIESIERGDGYQTRPKAKGREGGSDAEETQGIELLLDLQGGKAIK